MKHEVRIDGRKHEEWRCVYGEGRLGLKGLGEGAWRGLRREGDFEARS